MHIDKTFYIAPTKQQIDDAIAKANKAFEAFKKLPVDRRIAFLRQLSAEIETIRPDLVATADRETKLGTVRLSGEIDRTIKQINTFADLLAEGSWVNAIIDTPIPDRVPVAKPDLRQMQRPIGVVTVYGASNFPFAFSVAGGDTVSALAAGCPVLYKVHPGHPETSEIMSAAIAKAIVRAEMPDGLFTAFSIADHQEAMYLVTHPMVKAVGFTGSLNGGKALFDAAAARPEPIPVFAEMGSVNPVFILPGKLAEQAEALAKTLVGSNTLGAGQFCTNPGVIIKLRSDAGNSFDQHFKEALEATKGSPMLTANIYKSYTDGVTKLSALSGASTLGTGQAEADNAQPTAIAVSAVDYMKDAAFAEEYFGPCSVHVTAESEAELLQLAQHLSGQLTVSVWCNDADVAVHESLFHILENKAGRILINNAPTGVEVSHAMVHGGPFPATTDARTTSVGTAAIYRFTRPVCFQNFPQQLLPPELKNSNPLNIWRKVDGDLSKNPLH